MKKKVKLTDYVTCNLFLYKLKTNATPRNGNRISLLDRSDTSVKIGSFPPTKVVHYMFKNVTLNYTRSFYVTLPYGSHATLETTILFYPKNPVVM
jgi:hypothetical protein